jgi:hypothetical protein
MPQEEILNQKGSLDELTRNESVAVGVSSVQVLATTKKRTMFIITNSSAGGQTITLSLGFKVAVLGAGINLAPGQQYGEANGEGFLAFQSGCNAIASAAGGTLAVMER